MPPAAQVVNGRKTFIPLENNPDVLAHLCENLGVAPGLSFHDVISTSSEMLEWIPRPIHALVLLADWPIYDTARTEISKTIPDYKGSGPDEPVIWMKQTIGHACGLMALLHCLYNYQDAEYVTPGSELDKLLQHAIALGPEERADLLYNSKFLENAHMEAASRGSSRAPSPAEDNHHHFVGFVQKDGQVWELNGGMKGPLLRGSLEDGDLLSEKGLTLTVKDYLDAAAKGGNGEMSIVAVAGYNAQLL
ncbi:hypothetical protein PENSTE_c025G04008 [Penicillium steckii]|uniref:Ubiquitin carboxyl-terminal hydrolase n=1 Tax=Penicillium steckii TaxID=303698 RepID=A0A1V6SR02_9EURO|nr:hypothetical protein PENSTE_c025G04008 [Penicillium steckii]